MAFDRALGREFNFTEADLEANRSGVLTEDQLTMLRAGARGLERHAARNVPRIAVMLVVVVVVVAVMSRVMPGGGGMSPAIWVVLAAALGVVLVIAVLGSRVTRSRAHDLGEARLLVSEGTVSYDHDAFSELTRATIGGARFGVPGPLNALPEGGPRFRVHHVAVGKGAMVMSIERIDGD